MNIAAMFWGLLANNYDEQEGRYQAAHRKTVENAKKYLNAGDLVLDYGCATGVTAFDIADQVREIQAIDFSAKMIAAAKRNADQRGIYHVKFIQATIFDKRLEKETFDVILAFGILHLLKNPAGALQRIYDLLKPGGWFVSSSACMGDNETIPTWINNFLFIPGRIGILPILRFLKIPELEDFITCARFQIVETETILFSPTDDPTYIVGRFVAAKKSSGLLGENR